jgi:hypothetical protein
MAWIKRNLFFVIGGILALGLLGWAGYYNYEGWSRNQAKLKELTDIQNTLRDITTKKPSWGDPDKNIDNIKTAREQERELLDWIRRAGDYFKPIAPIPDTNAVSSADFAGALRRTIDQMQRDADDARVALPPRYTFSFTVQTTLVRFDPTSLGLLAEQLGEVKAIAAILFAARVNALDGIQRVRVSTDDTTAAPADYFDGHSETNNLAVLTPYQITFRSFTTEVGEVLLRFASSPHGFIVKGINVQPAGAFSGGGDVGAPGSMPPPSMGGPGPGSELMPPPRSGPAPGTMPPPGRGGLRTVLNEQLLRVTLVVEVVKVLPKK